MKATKNAKKTWPIKNGGKKKAIKQKGTKRGQRKMIKSK